MNEHSNRANDWNQGASNPADPNLPDQRSCAWVEDANGRIFSIPTDEVGTEEPIVGLFPHLYPLTIIGFVPEVAATEPAKSPPTVVYTAQGALFIRTCGCIDHVREQSNHSLSVSGAIAPCQICRENTPPIDADPNNSGPSSSGPNLGQSGDAQ